MNSSVFYRSRSKFVISYREFPLHLIFLAEFLKFLVKYFVFWNLTFLKFARKFQSFFQFFPIFFFLRSASQGATKLSTALQNENSIIRGVFFFRIEKRTGDDDETKCRKWVKFQEDNVKSLITALTFLKCPCSGFQAFFDSRFRFGPFIDSFTRNLCFYSSFPDVISGSLVSGFLFQKCCYSSFGALVLDDVGAGSVELLGSTLPDDVLDDFAAKRVCCYDSPNCDKFFSVRPSQNCRGYRPLRRSKKRLYFFDLTHCCEGNSSLIEGALVFDFQRQT